MNRIGVVVLLCLLAASSCSKKCEDISSENLSTTLTVGQDANLVLATFTGEMSLTGTAPPGMVLNNNAGQLTLSGKPTRTGDFTYTLTPATASCLQYPGGPNPVTEFQIFVAVRGPECVNGETPPQTIESCIGTRCENTLEVCSEKGRTMITTLPTRSLVSFSIQGDGHSEVTIRQYAAWFASASQGSVAPYELLKKTPAAGERLAGWFFTHDAISFTNAPELKIENLDPEHASTVTFAWSVISFDRGGVVGSDGELNTRFNFSAPNRPLFMSDDQHTGIFEVSLAEAPISWNLAVNDGCEHPGMTGSQDYMFSSNLNVGRWKVTATPVNTAANFRVSVRAFDGGVVLADGATGDPSFSLHEAQRVVFGVTPLNQGGEPIGLSSTCAFDGGFPPSVEWGGPQRIALELLSPDAGP